MHAIVRYDERAAGGMGLELASHRLCELVGCIGCETPPPDWLWLMDSGADFFVALGDDIVLPVRAKTAVTLLARGGLSDAARARRNHGKHVRRQNRRYASARGTARSAYPYQRMRSYEWTSAADGHWRESRASTWP